MSRFRQMNMDYCLSQALQMMNLDGLKKVIVFYDIMCQYHRRLHIRMDQSPYLQLAPGLVIIPGIGLFHVHGHQVSCLARFAPTFIKGAGQVDGEIIETLWSTLNDASRCTRTATLAHRTEMLNDHMNNGNWKKLVGISELKMLSHSECQLIMILPTSGND